MTSALLAAEGPCGHAGACSIGDGIAALAVALLVVGLAWILLK